MNQNTNDNYERQLIEFKELQAKSKSVSEHAIRLNTQIENAQENYRKLVDAADKKFNTHNTEELKAMLQSWAEDNAKRLENWSRAINAKAAEVEEKNRAMKSIQQN